MRPLIPWLTAALLFTSATLVACAPRDESSSDRPAEPPSSQHTRTPRPTPAQGGVPAYEPDCYGTKFEACLETSITAETPGVTASDCSGTGRRVCLVPMGAVRPDLVLHLSDHFRAAGLPVQVVPGIDIPPPLADLAHSQVVHWDLNDLAIETYGHDIGDWTETTLIVLTPVDIRDRDAPGGSFVFASRFGDGNDRWTSVISAFRFNPETFGEPKDDDLYFARVRKMMLKYIGADHLGFLETESTDTVMRVFINGVDLLDSLPEVLPPGHGPCYGDTARICLVPLGDLDEGMLQRVADDAERTYGVPVDVLPGADLDETYRDLIRGQYSEEVVLKAMWEAYPKLTHLPPAPILVAVTAEPVHSRALFPLYEDMTQEEILEAQVFAHANPDWPAGVISLAWDGTADAQVSDALEEVRLRKLLASIMGQVHLGIPVSADPTSLVSTITTVEQLDALPERLPGY